MMNAGQVHADIEAVLFSAADLQSRTGELGAQIARDYADKRPLLVAVLKGSFLFLADLARAIHPVPAGLQVSWPCVLRR